MPLPTTRQIAIPQFEDIGSDKSRLYENTGVTFSRLQDMYDQLHTAIFKEGDMRQLPVKQVMQYVDHIANNYEEMFVLLMQLGMDTQNFVAAGAFLDSQFKK